MCFISKIKKKNCKRDSKRERNNLKLIASLDFVASFSVEFQRSNNMSELKTKKQIFFCRKRKRIEMNIRFYWNYVLKMRLFLQANSAFYPEVVYIFFTFDIAYDHLYVVE